MSFSIVDIVLIAIVLIAVIIGLVKGLVKQLSSMISFSGTLAITILIYKYVAKYLLSSDLFYYVNNKFYSLLSSKVSTDILNISIETAGESGIKTALSGISIPSFLQSFFTKTLADTIASNPTMLVGDYISEVITTKTIVIGSFIASFIVILILISIIFKLLKKITDLPGITIIDKLLGATLKFVEIAIIVCFVFYLVTLVYKIPTIGVNVENFVIEQLKLNDDASMGVAKWVYLNNPITKALQNMSFEDLFALITGSN